MGNMSKRHFSKALFACLSPIAILVGIESAGTASTNRIDSVIPVIEFKDMGLDVVIRDLARQAGINFVFDPRTGFESSNQMAKHGLAAAAELNIELDEPHCTSSPDCCPRKLRSSLR